MDRLQFWIIIILFWWLPFYSFSDTGPSPKKLISVFDLHPDHPYYFLANEKDWGYQDVRINHETICSGIIECEARYQALKPLLDRFHRPFSVLDIGANNGFFALRIAEDYGATCVMIDGTERLRRICELNTQINHLVYLQKFMDPSDIEWLSQKEHFDVVLCFHLLHHVDWKRFVPALFRLGDHVIIETPPVNDGFVSLKPTIPEIARYLLSLPNAVQIGSFRRQLPEIKDHMIWFAFRYSMPTICRDFDRCEQFDVKKNQWVPIPLGISCATYKVLNGVFMSNESKNQ
jgi:SAM-dependent methyltransferase